MTRVIVVGHGMVASRLLQELASFEHDLRIDVFGAEEYEPYNRVLLSDFVMGSVTTAALRLPAVTDPRITEHRGSRITSIDRASSTVTTSEGLRHHYDTLVLATGAQARVVPLPGLPAEGLAGVYVLRSIDDARAIIAASVNARSAVVLGAGVLGLEVAAALARRTEVTVVHPVEAVMERQLSRPASEALVGGLATTGITTLTSTQCTSVISEDGRLRGVALSDGSTIDADVLVMAAGTVPEAGLALQAGLECAPGVVVTADLATPADPRIFAIGDCASPPEGGRGLVAQGWEQARRLARQLTGQPAATEATASPTDVVRVKGGLDVVVMGISAAALESAGQRRIALSDPSGHRFVEVVVADGIVVGATCVGSGKVAAGITAAYTRAAQIPGDPAHLLLAASATAAPVAASPTSMPERFTVCRCNGVTKADLVRAWHAGDRTAPEMAARTRVTTGCGGCTDVVAGIVEWLAASDPVPDASQPAQPGRDISVSSAKQTEHHLETSHS